MKALEAKRRALEEKLSKHELRQEETQEGPSSDSTEMARGLKLASEFVSGVLVGAAFGYGIDYLVGTMPLFFIVFLMLGFAAGVLNVLRSEGIASKRSLDDDGS